MGGKPQYTIHGLHLPAHRIAGRVASMGMRPGRERVADVIDFCGGMRPDTDGVKRVIGLESDGQHHQVSRQRQPLLPDLDRSRKGVLDVRGQDRRPGDRMVGDRRRGIVSDDNFPFLYAVQGGRSSASVTPFFCQIVDQIAAVSSACTLHEIGSISTTVTCLPCSPARK